MDPPCRSIPQKFHCALRPVKPATRATTSAAEKWTIVQICTMDARLDDILSFVGQILRFAQNDTYVSL